MKRFLFFLMLLCVGLGAAAQCGAPSGSGVTSITQTTATVSWTSGTSNFSYIVTVKKTSDGSTVAGPFTQSATFRNLTGLTGSTSYYITVSGICPSGSSGPVSMDTFTTAPTVVVYTPMTAPGYSYKRLSVDSAFNLPFGDTALNKGLLRPGSVVVYTGDSTMYMWNGKRYSAVNANLNALIDLINAKVDSVTVSGDSLFYWKQGVSYGTVFDFVSVSDTAAILLPYAKKDGANATGTWPISVTGNAATATLAANSTQFGGFTSPGTTHGSAPDFVWGSSGTEFRRYNAAGIAAFINGQNFNITGNAATVTNGVYTTTFNTLGDARYGQLSGNNTWSGTNTFSAQTNVNNYLSVTRNIGSGGIVGSFINTTSGGQGVYIQAATGTDYALQVKNYNASATLLNLTGAGNLELSGDLSAVNGTFAASLDAVTITAADQFIGVGNGRTVRLNPNFNGTDAIVGTSSNHPFSLITNNLIRYTIDASGNHDFKSGTATFRNTINLANLGGQSIDWTGLDNKVRIQGIGGQLAFSTGQSSYTTAVTIDDSQNMNVVGNISSQTFTGVGNRQIYADEGGILRVSSSPFVQTESGTYTPTVAGIVGVASVTANTAMYTRVGDVVTVYGSIYVSLSSSFFGTVEISLPSVITTGNFTNDFQLSGVAVELGGQYKNGTLYAYTGQQKAVLNTWFGCACEGTLKYSFSYKIQ